MQKAFFDEILKNTKTISCPKCNKEVEASIEDTEFFCEECGESFGMVSNISSEDFVWHPSEKY